MSRSCCVTSVNNVPIYAHGLSALCRKLHIRFDIQDGDTFVIYNWTSNKPMYKIKYDAKNDRFEKCVPEHWVVIADTVGMKEIISERKEKFGVADEVQDI